MVGGGLEFKSLDQALFCGGYPPLFDRSEPEPSIVRSWHDSYVQTYVERDVRLIRNVSDLATFRRFLRLCAGRVGQLLDLSGVGGDAGISHNTARDWVGILETGFIAFRLEPYFRNFSKRMIKSPKLYFYDTGLLCRLLDIRSPEELNTHPFRGAVFENYCVVEALKSFYNRGERPNIFFWRDQSLEVDLLIQTSSTTILAIECKSGATVVSDFMSAPSKLKEIIEKSKSTPPITLEPRVVFGGETSQTRSNGLFQSWRDYSNAVNSN